MAKAKSDNAQVKRKWKVIPKGREPFDVEAEEMEFDSSSGVFRFGDGVNVVGIVQAADVVGVIAADAATMPSPANRIPPMIPATPPLG